MSCSTRDKKGLPILGRHQYNTTAAGTDTVYHTINNFSFIDQDSVEISNKTFDGKVYVADFFFTTCPSICPVTTAQLLRIYDSFRHEPQVLILSHTIDPDYDKVPVLKAYSDRLEVSSDKWHFVTGAKQDIYNIAQTSYYVSVREDSSTPGGFNHSGAFVLVDGAGRIRGIYDGTDQEEVNTLASDIRLLLEPL